jgi:surfactin synthase thioesterase subunit
VVDQGLPAQGEDDLAMDAEPASPQYDDRFAALSEGESRLMPAARIIPRLERLTEGDEEPVILIVDFVPLSSAQRLGPLLCAHSTGREIYQIDPVTDLTASSSYVPLPDLAAVYSQAVLAQGITDHPTVVIGYCSAAALALLITDDLARYCRVSPVLVCPTRPDPGLIAAEFARFQADLGVAAGPCPSLGDAPDAVLEQMEAQLQRDLIAMAIANGFDTSNSALTYLLARYRSWLGFLLASSVATISPSPAQSPIQVILGSDDHEDLSWLGASRVHRFPVADKEFSESPSVAREILSHRC